jgi:two-component system sensor histidine kinase BaeS
MTEFHPRKMDLSALIARLISNYKLLIEGSGLVLDTAIEKEVYVYADPDMIRQLAANLISNAIRYTPEGGAIKVMVRKKNQTAELEVADTGIGIGEDDLELIFVKFHRAQSNKSNDVGGLGIGLAMVREIVEIHKGKIIAKSELGLGSSFTLTLSLED